MLVRDRCEVPTPLVGRPSLGPGTSARAARAVRQETTMAKGADKPKKEKKTKLTIEEKQKKKKEKQAAKGK